MGASQGSGTYDAQQLSLNEQPAAPIPQTGDAVQTGIQHGSATLPTRKQIGCLEALLKTLPQVELRVEHHFAPGMYIRTLWIPKDVRLVGEAHTKDHIFTLTQGELLVVTEEGRQRIKAPYQAVCRAGIKRVGLALSDVICSNIHLTDLTDLVAIKAECIESEKTPAIEAEATKWLG